MSIQLAPQIVVKSKQVLGHGGNRTYYQVHLVTERFTILLNDPYETAQHRAHTFAQQVADDLGITVTVEGEKT